MRPTPEPHPLVGYTIGAVVVDVVVLATGGDLDKQQAEDGTVVGLVSIRDVLAVLLGPDRD